MPRAATTSSTSLVGVLCSFSPLSPSCSTSLVSSRSILPASATGSCLAKPMNLPGYFSTSLAISSLAVS